MIEGRIFLGGRGFKFGVKGRKGRGFKETESALTE
jgi:hypothetical protein